MNAYFAAAGGLAFILALVHTVLGELLILRRLSKEGLPPLAPFSLIEARYMGLTGSTELTRRTLRLTWHLTSVLGVGFAAILLWLSLPSSAGNDLVFVQATMALSSLACSLVALCCSKGKHPAWAAFLAIAILTWLA